MEKKTTSSKWEFFGALYKYGSNPTILKEVLPHWSIAQIESFIKSYKSRAERKLKDSRKLDKSDDEAIDLWHDIVTNCHYIDGTCILPYNRKRKRNQQVKDIKRTCNFSFLLSKSMMYAAYFEDHFQSNDPDEPNYCEIYRYLSQLLSGEEPVQLRPGNASKVLEMISKLKEVMDNPENIQNNLNYLTNQHTVSFLKLGTDPIAVAEEKEQNAASNQRAADEKCQHYLDSCLLQDSDISNLDNSDLQSEDTRENILKMFSKKQLAFAETLVHIPGLNPMEMSAEALVKPNDVIIKPISNKYKRKKLNLTKQEN